MFIAFYFALITANAEPEQDAQQEQGDTGEDGEEEEEDPVAAMMGIGGFGSTKASCSLHVVRNFTDVRVKALVRTPKERSRYISNAHGVST